MNKTKGFILIIVLVFLQIFSLIGLFNISTVTHVMKSNSHLYQGYCLRLKSRQFLQTLEREIKPECIIPITPAPLLGKKPLSFWQVNACHANVDGIRYDYSVEWLGDDACAVMENGSQARYYRLTLKTGHYLLQSTLAQPISTQKACEGKAHLLQAGRQWLREI